MPPVNAPPPQRTRPTAPMVVGRRRQAERACQRRAARTQEGHARPACEEQRRNRPSHRILRPTTSPPREQHYRLFRNRRKADRWGVQRGIPSTQVPWRPNQRYQPVAAECSSTAVQMHNIKPPEMKNEYAPAQASSTAPQAYAVVVKRVRVGSGRRSSAPPRR